MNAILGAVVIAAIILVGSCAAYFKVNFENGHIQGNSMSPTMNHGDRMMSQRWGKDIDRGTIVVLKMPHNENEIVKRIIGLPHDIIMPPLADTQTNLGPGQYWVMGDNLELSKDSRHFGPITRDQITGVVTHVRRMR